MSFLRPIFNKNLPSSSHHEISVSLFEQNRRRLISRLKILCPPGSVVLLQGGRQIAIYDTGCHYEFVQESFFFWAFGVDEPDCYGVIQVDNGKAYLFIPRMDTAKFWTREWQDIKHFKRKYNLNNVLFVDEMLETFKGKLGASCVLLLNGFSTNSGLWVNTSELMLTLKDCEQFRIDEEILYEQMALLRSIKTKDEIDVMKYVCEITVNAQMRLMRFVRYASRTAWECDIEFQHYIATLGACKKAIGFFASGMNNIVLDFEAGDRISNCTITKNELCLFTIGARYFNYCSNISSTFPANGKFTTKQKHIYEACLEALAAFKTLARPFVKMELLQEQTLKELLNQLRAKNLVKGDIDQMMSCGIGHLFMPHPVSNLLGLDLHDVGGYVRTSSGITDPFLSMNRELGEDMVLTVCVGCYFVDVLLDEALKDPAKSQFLVKDVIKSYRDVGGVRIGDEVLITRTGNVCWCDSLPRSVLDLEKCLSMPRESILNKIT